MAAHGIFGPATPIEAMTDSPLLRVEAAQDLIAAAIGGPTPVELRGPLESLGLVVASTVTSPMALPPWDNSAMDGYAIRAADVSGAVETSPVRLEVIGEVRAGQTPDLAVRDGTAIRIATGAVLPPGADAVVAVELTTPVDARGALGPRGRDATGPLPVGCLVHAAVTSGASVRRAGSDLSQDAPILIPGMVMTPAAVALAAGSGVTAIPVHARPRVGVLTTGDEIRAPGADLGPAGIPDANGPALLALVEAAGAQAHSLGTAADRFDDVHARLAAGLAAGLDAIIVSGGVSVGPYDVVRAAFEAFGTIELWRVAVQPGKPFAFGTARAPVDDGSDPARRPTLLFGLPGNPVSTFVTFEIFVRPALRRLAGHRGDDLSRPLHRAVLDEPVTKSQGRRAFIRVRARRDRAGNPVRDAHGRVHVALAGGTSGQGSHVLSALAQADALAVIPEATDSLPAGAPVDLCWLERT